MCGRYFLELKALMELEERIDYTFERDLLIAKDYYPSNIVPIIIDRDNKLELKKAKWGFSTFDNKLIINARSETLLEKPFFKKEVITHRCLIPASGFYEWDGHKHVNGQTEVTIVTTKANKSMCEIHDRMPLILEEHLNHDWLENRHIEALLRTVPQSLTITSGFLQSSLF